jgi:hypothetical protein
LLIFGGIAIASIAEMLIKFEEVLTLTYFFYKNEQFEYQY